MKRLLVTFSLLMLVSTAIPVSGVAEPKAVKIAPPAPRFTEAERHAELARRRAAVAAKMADNSIMVLFPAEPRIYTNDVDYVYRQENNHYYLTSLKQDGSTLVIAKSGGKVTETLFLPKRVAFREAWEGKMYSREQATAISGLTTIVDSSEREALLTALKDKKEFRSKDGAVTLPGSADNIYLVLPDGPQDRDGMREFRAEHEFSKTLNGYKVENAQVIFAELRHIKSPYELKMLQHAIDITTEAQMRSMATVGQANWEYEVHAEVEYTFRRRNADFWGYPSIVGCGANATTLHYVESQSPIKKGELLLMDVGAEYEHYTADVTRTYPVNGKFTKEQAEIYQIVYDAQEAVAKATKPGATFGELSQIARKTIGDGLFRLGLVTKKDSPQTGVWFIHGLGHWLGMNVHDVGTYSGPLRPGMVFTNEPGIYIREDALDNLPDTPENRDFIIKVRPVFEKYKNIGVRIEDDMLVTPTGVIWMTKALPRSIRDIEAFIALNQQPVRRTRSSLKTDNLFTDGTAQMVNGHLRTGFSVSGS
ncbi:MAG: aminopeptidase P family protein [Pyrinomonadaceae bacterium]|nr:aminopeptidase P family protein [Pyrinomonadaceae bacterium]